MGQGWPLTPSWLTAHKALCSTCYRVIWKVCVFFPNTAYSKTTNQLSRTVKHHASLNGELWVKETVHVLLFHSPLVVRSCRFQQDRSQLEIITTRTGIWCQNTPENQYQQTYITNIIFLPFWTLCDLPSKYWHFRHVFSLLCWEKVSLNRKKCRHTKAAHT